MLSCGETRYGKFSYLKCYLFDKRLNFFTLFEIGKAKKKFTAKNQSC